MAKLHDLTLLAKHAPIIFGRALGLDEVIKVAPTGDRSDHVDNHSPEIQRALHALTLIQRLYRTHKQAAMILYQTHVVFGSEVRKQKQTWVDLGLLLREKKPKKINPKIQEELLDEGLAAYYFARNQWEVLK